MEGKPQLTRGGVCYDLRTTPFIFEVSYNDELIRYAFSSEYNRTSFRNRIMENRENINNSLTKRFKIEISMDKLADIKLYSNIEKRGFLIETDRESIEWLSIIRLDGNKVMKKNSQE